MILVYYVGNHGIDPIWRGPEPLILGYYVGNQGIYTRITVWRVLILGYYVGNHAYYPRIMVYYSRITVWRVPIPRVLHENHGTEGVLTPFGGTHYRGSGVSGYRDSRVFDILSIWGRGPLILGVWLFYEGVSGKNDPFWGSKSGQNGHFDWFVNDNRYSHARARA